MQRHAADVSGYRMLTWGWGSLVLVTPLSPVVVHLVWDSALLAGAAGFSAAISGPWVVFGAMALAQRWRNPRDRPWFAPVPLGVACWSVFATIVSVLLAGLGGFVVGVFALPLAAGATSVAWTQPLKGARWLAALFGVLLLGLLLWFLASVADRRPDLVIASCFAAMVVAGMIVLRRRSLDAAAPDQERGSASLR